MSILGNIFSVVAPRASKSLYDYQDSQQVSSDLSRFEADPINYKTDLGKYNDPAKALAVNEHLDKLRKVTLEKLAEPDMNKIQGLTRQAMLDPTNPLPSQALQFFRDDSATMSNPNVNKAANTATAKLDAFGRFDQFNKTADPTALAFLQSEGLAQPADQGAQALDRIASANDRTAKATAVANEAGQLGILNQFIAEADKGTYGDGTPGSYMRDLTKTMRDFQIANKIDSPLADKRITEYMQDQYAKQSKVAWDTRSKTIGKGDAVKYIDEVINPHGEILRTESSFKPTSTRIDVNYAGKQDDVRTVVDRFVEQKDINLLKTLTRNEKSMAIAMLTRGQKSGLYPADIDVNKIVANLDQETDPMLRRANARIDGALPLAQGYIEAAKALPMNTRLKPINKLTAAYLSTISDPALKLLETKRFYMVREANRAVTNGVMAQAAIDEEMALFSSSNTAGEAIVAGEELVNALRSARQGNSNNPFPEQAKGGKKADPMGIR